MLFRSCAYCGISSYNKKEGDSFNLKISSVSYRVFSNRVKIDENGQASLVKVFCVARRIVNFNLDIVTTVADAEVVLKKYIISYS